MATAPATASEANALIMALRGATPMQGQASTLRFYDNPKNTVYTPRERPVYVPPTLPPNPVVGPPAPPTPGPAPVAPSPVAPEPPPPFVAPLSPSPVVGPQPAPVDDLEPDVPDYTDDLWGDPEAPVPDREPVETYPVVSTPLPPSNPIEELKEPSVEVIQDLPVSTTPVSPTDPNEDFEIDRELGIVPQYDVYSPFVAANKPTEDEKQPSVEVVQDLDVSTDPAPATDAADDFEIDRELGLVPQWDMLSPTNTNSAPTPSVEVIQGLDVTDTPAVNTDAVENFEIDRELGLVPEWDIMESVEAPTAAPAINTSPSIRNVGNVTSVTEPLDVYYPFDDSLFNLIDTPPSVENIAPEDSISNTSFRSSDFNSGGNLTQREMDELSLFGALTLAMQKQKPRLPTSNKRS